MISLDITIQGTEEVPSEIADWVAERNAQYPGIDFRIGRDVPRIPEQESEQLNLAREYQQTFHGGLGNANGDAAVEGVYTVGFHYGTEAWYVRIIGGVTASGEYKAMSNSEPDEIVDPLSAEIRNQIAGFTNDELVRFVIKGHEDRGTTDHISYGYKRTADNPLIDKPETLSRVEWEARLTSALSMTGAEFEEMTKNPEQMRAASSLLRDAKRGRLH